jgi:hypothetical protein
VQTIRRYTPSAPSLERLCFSCRFGLNVERGSPENSGKLEPSAHPRRRALVHRQFVSIICDAWSIEFVVKMSNNIAL